MFKLILFAKILMQFSKASTKYYNKYLNDTVYCKPFLRKGSFICCCFSQNYMYATFEEIWNICVNSLMMFYENFWNLVLWLVKLNCFLTHVILCQTVNDYWCKTNWCTMMLIIANWCVISLPLMVIFIALYNIEIYQSILCVPYDLIKHSNP